MTLQHVATVLEARTVNGTLTLSPGDLGSPLIDMLLSANFPQGKLVLQGATVQSDSSQIQLNGGTTTLFGAAAVPATARFRLVNDTPELVLTCTPPDYNFGTGFPVFADSALSGVVFNNAQFVLSSSANGNGVTFSGSHALPSALEAIANLLRAPEAVTFSGPLVWVNELPQITLTSTVFSGVQLGKIAADVRLVFGTTVVPLDSPAGGALAVPLFQLQSTLDITAATGLKTVAITADLPVGGRCLITVKAALDDVSLADLTGLATLVGDLSFPPDIPIASQFDLTQLNLLLSPATAAIVGLSLQIKSASAWSIVPDHFSVEAVWINFIVNDPFESSREVFITVGGALTVNKSVEIDLSYGLPGNTLTAQLASGDTIPLSSILSGFLPGTDLPELSIVQLEFGLDVVTHDFQFEIDIMEDWPVSAGGTSSLSFTELSLFLSRSSGDVTARVLSNLTVAGAALQLSAGYQTEQGWNFAGGTRGEQNISLTNLLADALSLFGLDLPATAPQIVITNLQMSLATQNKDFGFICDGSVTVMGETVYIGVNIARAHDQLLDPSAVSTTFSGYLIIGGQKFTADFKSASQGKAILFAWHDTGEPLGFEAIASFFGWHDMPALPENLDLGLKDAEIYYDFDVGTVVVSANSVNYGQILFASLVASQASPNAGKRTYLFSLDVPLNVDLSDVPLAGDKLPAGVKLGIDDLQVIIASDALETTDVTALNKLITDALQDSALIPKSLSSGLTFATNLEMGGSVQPIILPLTSAKPAAHAELAAAAVSDAPAQQGSATWFNVEKSFGPVQFQRLGVQYQNGTLSFLLDATLRFGPLSLSLMGLGVGSSLTKFKPVFALQGLGVEYSNPPLQIAGELINLAPPGRSYIEFEGGVTVGTGEFTIEAFGYFGDKSGFPSMFIFGAAASDFGGPPAFFVTGAALGFGYNSNVRMPTIDEVATFPFIKVLPTSAAPDPNALGPNATPLSVLQTITNSQPPWVSAVKDSLWFAAGITFTSFELVNSQALVIVEAGSELVITLLGTSRARFPQSGGTIYANIEMDLEARFVPAEGIFSIQAVLAPSSFVIDKACVLTGGFAFYVWYGNNPHSGDFVLTLGGYNPGFTPPSYYPAVPQVGFHWAMDSSITIQGGAYFALTPAALMVGGELSATYQAGNLKAWFNAHADAIIRWKPFWFDIDIGISIGASYKIDLLFTSCTISVEFGCDLEFWGPPTGGTVSVDWYIISFTIPFGSDRDPTQGIKGWSDVEAMLPNTGSDSARNVLSLTPTSGLIPNGTSPGGKTAAARSNGEGKGNGNGDGSPWIVRGSTFGFNTSTHIPATTVKVGDSHTFSGSTFNVHPLQWKGVSALHTVTIIDPLTNDFSGCFEAAPIHNDVPASLWGAPPEAGGKSQVPAGSDQVVPGQIVGVSLQVNPPVVGYSAGPVDVKYFSSDNLTLAGAVLPLSQSAPPEGDVAVNGQETIGKIADKDSGIASDAVSATRTAIFNGLDSLHYAPETNDPMTDFAAGIGCALSAEPLLVPKKSQ